MLLKALSLCVVLALAVSVTAESTPPRPAGVPKDAQSHGGSVTIVHPAIQELDKCKQAINETLFAEACFTRALTFNSMNHSWWASLALVYLRSEQYTKAHQAMDNAVSAWLNGMKDFLTEAGKKHNKTELPYSQVLRDLFDDNSTGSYSRRDESIEMGLLLARKFEMEGKATDASNIYYDFLLQAGQGRAEVLDFHRRTGNLIAMVMTTEHLNETGILWRLAESVQPALEGFIESTMRLGSIVSPSSPIRRMCGVEFSQNDEFRASDVINKMSSCLTSWGNLSEAMSKEPKSFSTTWTSLMQEQPIHRLASLGATDIIREAMKPGGLEGSFIKADRAGRTSLHQAATNGRTSTVKFLLGGQASQEEALEEGDKGRITPKILGCGAPGYKTEFENEIAGKGACEKLTRDKIAEDIDVTDDSGNDGEWNPKRKRPKYLHCDFDVRDASAITQGDLMVGYVHSGHPILLRNSFYETDGPVKAWKRNNFNRTYGKSFVRVEPYPMSDRWGLGEPNVTTISDFLAGTNITDVAVEHARVASVAIDSDRHPLHKLVNEWSPPSFSNRKKSDDIFLFDTEQTWANLVLSKPNSRGSHRVYTQHTYHAMVYGHQQWTLLPPRHARTIRGHELSDTMKLAAMRCDVFTGDVLVIPEMWSASWVARANGVSMERTIYRRVKE